MSERYERIMKSASLVRQEGSPVQIQAWALLRDSKEDRQILQVKLINDQPEAIERCEILIRYRCGESEKKEVFTYTDIQIAEGDSFGTQTPIAMPKDELTDISIVVTSVLFSNGTSWPLPEKGTQATPQKKAIQKKTILFAAIAALLCILAILIPTVVLPNIGADLTDQEELAKVCLQDLKRRNANLDSLAVVGDVVIEQYVVTKDECKYLYIAFQGIDKNGNLVSDVAAYEEGEFYAYVSDEVLESDYNINDVDEHRAYFLDSAKLAGMKVGWYTSEMDRKFTGEDEYGLREGIMNSFGVESLERIDGKRMARLVKMKYESPKDD